MVKIKIFTFVGWYLPGCKGGGPIRTLANMVDRLANQFEFKIVTSDRDSGDSKPYSGIAIDKWNNVGKAKVFYISLKHRFLWDIRRILKSTEYDILYLNSFFSFNFTIKPLILRRLGLIANKSVVIAPRGEFSYGALNLKRLKKQVYIVVSKIFKLYKGVVWQASSRYEAADIRNQFGDNVRVIIAPDLPSLHYVGGELMPKRKKNKGFLKIIFLSRISRTKNLKSALMMFNDLKGEIQFHIYGPIEDKKYWDECQNIISGLSDNIKVQYCENVAYDQVFTIIEKYDLFFLPTLGENFSHVILESLCAGCPVLISDKTPWRALDKKGVGWDLSLSRPKLFKEVLQNCVDMDSIEYDKLSKRARDYGLRITNDEETVEKNCSLFKDS